MPDPYDPTTKTGFDLLPKGSPCRQCPCFDGAKKEVLSNHIIINCEHLNGRNFIKITPIGDILSRERCPIGNFPLA